MRVRPALIALVAVLSVLGTVAPATAAPAPLAEPGPSVAVGGSPDASASHAAVDTARADANTTQSARPDPDEDVLGWERGYWYDDPVAVDRSDGLNDTELDAVVARSAARVEEVRGIEIREIPPVEVISREEFRNSGFFDTSSYSAEFRLHQNVKWEAMFMVDESTDAVGVNQRNLAGGVGGFYSPSQERIVIVSDDTDSPQMNEVTLAQELFHAIQDQRFDSTSINRSTVELNNAANGIIEGDGNYVDYRYEQRCEAEWDCLLPRGGGGGGGGTDDLHLGLYQVNFQPYSDGQVFVRDIYERDGWAAVNAVYDRPPASTEQVIHPEKYPTDEPTTLSIEDRSNETWSVLELPGGLNHAQFGEAGLFVMFWYPSYVESQSNSAATDVVIPYRAHLNLTSEGRLDPVDPFNYNHPATAGWDGDRLLPYVRADSATTNETGYVWETAWDTDRDAREFADAYRTLLEYHGAERVGQNTYRIPEEERFGDAYHLIVDGTRVTIINAPTVDSLSGVDGRVAIETVQETTTTTTTSTDTPTSTTSTATSTTDEPPTTTTSTTSTATEGPGFGPLAVLVALVALLGVGLRRRQRS